MTRRTAPKRPVHLWQAEPGVTDWRGQPLCTCGQPRTARTHQLPDNPAAAEEARRLGEREDPT